MLGIELSTGQKVQVAFILVVLTTAGYFLFKATRSTLDTSVNSWTLARHYGVDRKKPISPAKGTNPLDPKQDELVTVFACADGQLEITQYLNTETPRAPTMKFTPEKRNAKLIYQFYQDPMAPVEAIKDPFRHALAYATYNFVILNRKLGLLGKVGMNADQLAKESEAQTIMTGSLTNITTAIDNGTFHTELMDKVLKALKTYKDKTGDPQKDDAKADLARQVLLAATTYMKIEQQERGVIIGKYMDKMDAVLTADQKQKLIDAVAAQMAPKKPAVPTTTRRAPAAGGTATPAAGARGTTTAGARGGRAGAAAPAAPTAPGN